MTIITDQAAQDIDMTATTQTRKPKGAPASSGGQFTGVTREPATIEEPKHALDQYFESLDEKIAAMHEEVVKKVASLEDDDNWNDYLNMMSKFRNYSLNNQMLIWLQNPDATKVGGKRVWDSLGRKLKPAAERGRGISIFAPKMGLFDKKDKDGNVLKGPDGKPLKEKRVFGFTSCTVYDISQTEGDELPSVQRELSEEPPPGFVSDLQNAIEKSGYKVVIDDSLSGSKMGYTSPTTKEVHVSAHLTEGSKAQVLAHELGHIVAGHCDEDSDRPYHSGHGGQRGAMEVEAESISHVLLRLNGMKTPGDVTGTYVAGWASVQKDNPEVVAKSASIVTTSVKKLFADHNWSNS